MADRAVLFIDGNHWYHSLKDAELQHLRDLDYAKISQKLIGPREWLGTRYYIGQVPQSGNTALYADQRRFLARLRSSDRRVTTHLGRLEPRPVKNPAADELLQYLHGLSARIPQNVFRDLQNLAGRHRSTTAMVEKAVDVMLAVDMVVMAERDQYDAAYLLSADGDFTPAVAAVKECGKKVYAVSLNYGAQLAKLVDSFIRLPGSAWFTDCYR